MLHLKKVFAIVGCADVVVKRVTVNGNGYKWLGN